MSQQVPFDNNGVPFGNDMVSATHGPQDVSSPSQNASGIGTGYFPPGQGQKMYSRNMAPMINPIESARLTPQILVLLIFSGIRRHWKWSIPLGLVLGLLAAGSLYLAFPLQYEAYAPLHIRSVIPKILSEGSQVDRYNEFVSTQIALMQSPVVIDAALLVADVAKLPIVLKQKDRRTWLKKQLQVRPNGRSEIVDVGIATDDPVASEKIVNAVIDSYMALRSSDAIAGDRNLTAELQSEKRKQTNEAQLLQNSIRSKNVQAALEGAESGEKGLTMGLGQGESLLRDIHLTDAHLTALRATRDAIISRIEQPSQVPLSVLIRMDPELSDLNSRRDIIQQQKEAMLPSLRNPDADPRIQQFDKQITDLDEKINAVVADANGKKKEEVQGRFRVQEEYNLYLIDQEIREKEILLETLQKKYTNQLRESALRTGAIVDASFETAQLDRINKVLGMIEDRILSIQSSRQAPAQIIPLSPAVVANPNWQRQIMIIGGGVTICAFLPLLLGIVIERTKPRLYHVSQVRRSVPHVLIGEIMEPPVSWIHGATFRKRLARYRESVHNWCTHLLLSEPFRSCRTLSIASVAGDDGKTFLAVQIAVAMAQMKAGNVLLIDGDMRVGRLHLLFGNEEAGIGLADVLSFRNGFGEAMVQNEKEPNLHLLSAGQLDVTPYELLGDGRFRELLDMLEQSYSLILVVLPPVAHAAESLIMAASTDSSLLCVRQGETVLGAMEDVYRKLVNTGASVDGIVVKDIPYYQMAGKDGGFADKLEQIRLSHLLQYSE